MSLNFDELNQLVGASYRTQSEDELIETVRTLLTGAYERAVLDMDEEFDYLYMNYPEMLGIAIDKPTKGLTWEQRIRSWYHGENPNTEESEKTSEETSSKRPALIETSKGDAPVKGAEAKQMTEEEILNAIQRVVETETHRMYNTGAYDTAVAMQKSTGKTVLKRWDTMMDEKVRATHDYLEGEAIPLDEAFWTFDGDSAMFPGDFANPANNINCRCTLGYTTTV